MLRDRVFGPRRLLVMAIINRTPDSFYVSARHTGADAAERSIATAAVEGADLIDVGGVRAGRGADVGAAEEIDRVLPTISHIRRQYPELLISVDTWRSEVAREAIAAGADLINDTWAGADPEIVDVAGRHGVGIVCSHTGGLTPRTDPHRVAYSEGADTLADRTADPLLDDVLNTLGSAAERAVAAGVDPRSVLIDPTHDFGKNTWQSLSLLRQTDTLAALGYPLLMALSRKDFVGESLGLAPDQRLHGTLAATAVAAWMGAKVFRSHDVAATREAIDMVAVARGDLPPLRAVRGLA